MKRRDALLKLVLPLALEEAVVDHLLQHPEWVGPFLTRRGEGHGAPERIASAAEQVRGRAELVEVEILMAMADVPQLVGHLREDLGNAYIVWWVTAVADGGAFR